jgi:hypothetical protein
VEPRADIETSETFHRSVMNRLRREDNQPWWRKAARPLLAGNFWNWRIAAPVAAVLVVLVLGVFLLRNDLGVPVAKGQHAVGPLAAAAIPAPDASSALAPTLANYLNAAGASPQQLDDLLTAQAQKALPPVPADAASVLALAKATD